jgi:pilus assembly protein CpaB
MKRRGGILWLSTAFILAVLAALLTLRFLNDAVPSGAPGDDVVTEPVVVARSDVPMRTLLSDDVVVIRQVPPELVPVGAATMLDQVLGKINMSDLVMGEVVLTRRLADPAKKGVDILFTMSEDKIVIALPGDDLMSRAGLLRPGDKVDILYSLEMGEASGNALVTFEALQNQEITAIVLPGLPTEAIGGLGGMVGSTDVEGDMGGGSEVAGKVILLAVDPQDALMLKYLKDAGGILDFALRVPTNEQFMRTEPVTEDYLADRYRIETSIEPLGIELGSVGE